MPLFSTKKPKLLFGDKAGWNEVVREHLQDRRYVIHCRSDQTDLLPFSEYDAFIPQAHSDFNLAWSHPDLRSLVPDRALYDLADNKKAFNSWLIKNGFGDITPEVYSNESLTFPCVLKRAKDAFGMFTRIIRTQAELDQLLASGDYEDSFCQELVLGDREFTTHILSLNGDIHFSRTVEFVFDTDSYVKGKFHPHLRKIIHDTCEPRGRELIKALNFTGLSCLNYKLCDGRMRVFEMNPRYGASLSPFMADVVPAYLKLLKQRDRAATSGT